MLVLDMATTAVAGNRVLLAQKRGDKTIPEGWANDDRGRPTTDPAKASVRHLQWFGGYKGYGIALFIEIIAGVMTGASFGLVDREPGELTRLRPRRRAATSSSRSTSTTTCRSPTSAPTSIGSSATSTRPRRPRASSA